MLDVPSLDDGAMELVITGHHIIEGNPQEVAASFRGPLAKCTQCVLNLGPQAKGHALEPGFLSFEIAAQVLHLWVIVKCRVRDLLCALRELDLVA